jgi:hypothetical protein
VKIVLVGALAIILTACNRYRTVPPECDEPEPIGQSNITWGPRDSAGVISGLSVDAQSLKPVSGALIVINPGNHGAVTDVAGNFRFNSISPGSYELLIRRIGYAPGRMRIDMTDSAGMELSVQLQARPTQLDGCGYAVLPKRKPGGNADRSVAQRTSATPAIKVSVRDARSRTSRSGSSRSFSIAEASGRAPDRIFIISLSASRRIQRSSDARPAR